MNFVSDLQIENAWNEVAQASSSPEQLSQLMDRFGEAEPAIVEFVSEASSQWGSDAVDLAFHASLVIWKSFLGESQSAMSVAPETLIACFEKNAEWIEQQQGEAILVQKKLSDFSRFPQSELMRYAVELILEAHEDGLEIEPEEQQGLLLVLKTLIDALSG